MYKSTIFLFSAVRARNDSWRQFTVTFLIEDKTKTSATTTRLARPKTGRAMVPYLLKLEHISDSDRANMFTCLRWGIWRPRIKFRNSREDYQARLRQGICTDNSKYYWRFIRKKERTLERRRKWPTSWFRYEVELSLIIVNCWKLETTSK
jgi:hypothetical protein